MDKQRRDLDGVRKEVMEKEMLCSALRVGIFSHCSKPVYWFIYCIRCHALDFFFSFFFFTLNIETDVIPGDSTERCPSCQRRGSKTQDKNENLSKVQHCSFLASNGTVQNVITLKKKCFLFFSACLNA